MIVSEKKISKQLQNKNFLKLIESAKSQNTR